MSGSYRTQDGYLYWPLKLDSLQEVLIASTFDMQVDQDEFEIETKIQEEKLLRKVCLFKILTFIPEYFFSVIILGKDASNYKFKAGKLYWGYYRRKITLDVFKKELTLVMNTGTII